jgi:hypothetical protein
MPSRCNHRLTRVRTLVFVAPRRYMVPGLVDMWIAVHSDFFIGQVFSSFDQAVCWMRGAEKADTSNICAGMIDQFSNPEHKSGIAGYRYVSGLIVR